MEKLLKDAESQGITVLKNNGNNSLYLGTITPFKKKLFLEEAKRQIKKSNFSEERKKELLEKYKKKLDSLEGKELISLGNLGNGKLSGPDALSHELGHAQYMKKGRSKSVLGKVSHKLNLVSKVSTTGLGDVAWGAYGYKTGVDAARKKAKGEKVSVWDRTKHLALPALVASPLLIAEGKASLNGLKRLKKLGASEELLKQSRSNLAKAWGTYGVGALRPVAVSELTNLGGYQLEKYKQKKTPGYEEKFKKKENPAD